MRRHCAGQRLATPDTMSQQIKDLMRKYGKTAVGVHLGVYATTFAGEHGIAAGGMCAGCTVDMDL